jgi:hypothetical protein
MHNLMRGKGGDKFGEGNLSEWLIAATTLHFCRFKELDRSLSTCHVEARS